MPSESPSLPTTLITGLAAGALATVVMGQVTTLLYNQQSRATRRRDEHARGSRTAYAVAARKAADALGIGADDDQLEGVGTAMHYAIGATSAAAYGLVRRHLPAPAPIRGLALGSTLWLAADEGAVPALGLTPGPLAFPWQTHVRGLVGHLAFGLAVEAVFAASDRVKSAFA